MLIRKQPELFVSCRQGPAIQADSRIRPSKILDRDHVEHDLPGDWRDLPDHSGKVGKDAYPSVIVEIVTWELQIQRYELIATILHCACSPSQLSFVAQSVQVEELVAVQEDQAKVRERPAARVARCLPRSAGIRFDLPSLAPEELQRHP